MTATSPEMSRIRWARFVQRGLDAAHYRGMTDKDIEKATGVMSSTFHRWRRGEVRTSPDIVKVRAFCEGLGLNLEEAMTALGVTGQRDNPDPEPALPPEFRALLRRLNDPNTPDTEKLLISETIAMLANRPSRRGEQTG